METRNIIAAISLSAAVILLYTLFFAPPPVTQDSIAEKNIITLPPGTIIIWSGEIF